MLLCFFSFPILQLLLFLLESDCWASRCPVQWSAEISLLICLKLASVMLLTICSFGANLYIDSGLCWFLFDCCRLIFHLASATDSLKTSHLCSIQICALINVQREPAGDGSLCRYLNFSLAAFRRVFVHQLFIPNNTQFTSGLHFLANLLFSF